MNSEFFSLPNSFNLLFRQIDIKSISPGTPTTPSFRHWQEYDHGDAVFPAA